MTKKIIRLHIGFCLLFFAGLPTLTCHAQQLLSLDSCRSLALRNNRQLQAARLKKDVAFNTRKATRTKYLPKVDVVAGYEYTNREVSILNNQQKSALANLGSNAANALTGSFTQTLQHLVQLGIISPDVAQHLGQAVAGVGQAIGQAGNQVGQKVVDAFRTDTRNLWAGAVMLRQPIYMGGAITAANRMADLGEQLASNQYQLQEVNTRYTIDQTYWLVVSLQEKQELAGQYLKLVEKLNSDVHKMIEEGVATRADGLKVEVRVNEAEMALTQAEDGVQLAKMLLCQLCGLPLDTDITLTSKPENLHYTSPATPQQRIELQMMQNAVDISKQNTRLVRAEYLPHIALTGGYLVSNPNVYNGFQRRFSGTWNVGILLQMPIWNWFESSYKLKATKAATSIAETELRDAQEKIDLQIQQCQFKLKEAQKRNAMALKNMASAEENLRCANVGFREGVMESTDVMAAQTAWQSAHNQKIDAEIGIQMAQLDLEKALGTLTY